MDLFRRAGYDHGLEQTKRAPVRRPKKDRRSELIAAASRVVAREGIERTTTRRIAEEAGVPPGLVHYWFATMDELIEAVIEQALLTPVQDAVAEARASDDNNDVLSQLRAVLDALGSDDRGQQIATYELTTFMLRRPELHHVARRHYTTYRELGAAVAAEAATARGVPMPAPASVLGTLLTSVVDGLFLAWLADPEGTDVDAVLRLMSELIVPSDSEATVQTGAASDRR
jgi:AcrR family transcriptional regulator